MDVSREKILLLYVLFRRCRPQKRKYTKKRYWVHNVLEHRHLHGEYHRLVQELILDGEMFRQTFRLTTTEFEEVLNAIGESITKQRNNYRIPISPKERLIITLRFLATGDSYRTIVNSYRVGRTTVCHILEDTLPAIWENMVDRYMPATTSHDWKTIAEGFKEKWNFPNCIGALDGKHVQIKAPPNSGSAYFNYKGTHSVVLLALVDANYAFRVVSVGGYGKNSDGGILSNSVFGKRLLQGNMDIPQDRGLPGAGELGKLPHTIVADEAFPLKRYLMRPYPGKYQPIPQRVFNYRLSCARRIVENAFGILANQWRCFHRVLDLHPDKVDVVIKAACILHNLMRFNRQNPSDAEITETEAGTQLMPVSQLGSNNAAKEAFIIRDKFAFQHSWRSSLAVGACVWSWTILI